MDQEELYQRFLFLLQGYLPEGAEPPELYDLFEDLGVDEAAAESFRRELELAFSVQLPEGGDPGPFELFRELCSRLPLDEEL